MDRFLTLSVAERANAIQETAARMRLHPTPVEKDFWVCWMLRALFELSRPPLPVDCISTD